MTTAESALAALQDPAVRADPYPLYAALRERSPLLVDGPTLVVGGWDDARRVLTDVGFSSEHDPNGRGEPDGSRPFLMMDPPDHTRLRGLVVRAFAPAMIASLRPRIEEIVDDALDAGLERGRMDLAADLAQPLPVTVIAELLGVPAADRDRLADWSQWLTRSLDVAIAPEDAPMVARAGQELAGYFAELVEFRRRRPADDLLTSLIAVEERGERLSTVELLSTIGLLVVAGHETTSSLIGNGLLALLRHPEHRAHLADPAGGRAVVEETLRHAPPVQLAGRISTVPARVGDVDVAPGTWVVVLLAAANRDPAAYPDPDRFDPTRPANRHLAFSAGPHTCLGAALARLEAEIVFRRFAERVGDAGLDEDGVRYRPHVNLRGPSSLPVTLTAPADRAG